MKKWKILIFITVLYTQIVLSAPLILDKIAAIVNDSVILESDINNIITNVKYNVKNINPYLLNEKNIHRKILEQLIMDSILLQIAQQNNITISDKQIDQTINNIIVQNNITIEQLHENLNHLKIDYVTYREQIRKEILIAEVVNNEIRQRIIILPQEVDSLSQQIASETNNNKEFKLSHIIVPLPEKYTQSQLFKAETLANSLAEKINSSLDINDLSGTYSYNQKPFIEKKIGWKKLKELPLLFTVRLKNATKNSVIGPISSDIGFHILKVDDIRNDDQKIIVNEVHARHILLRPSIIMTDEQAYAKLRFIATQIKNCQLSFSTAAKQLSEDYNSANQGGDLGWNPINAFDQELRNELMHLKKGEVSKPVYSSLGWHLIQLIDTRQVDRTISIQKDQAYEILFNRKFTEEAHIWMQEQRASAYVKIIDNQ